MKVFWTMSVENCAAWVNSILERVGIPKSEREHLGEFFGIDWGEEDLLPTNYLQAILQDL